MKTEPKNCKWEWGNERIKSKNAELAGVGDKYVLNMKENEYGEKIKFNFSYAEIKVSLK